MKKYKVKYSGFIFVEAENIEDAVERAIDEDIVYEEKYDYEACEVDDFVVMI